MSIPNGRARQMQTKSTSPSFAGRLAERFRGSPAAQHLFALLLIALAAEARGLLNPVLRDRAPYELFLFSVAIVGLTCQLAPTILSILYGCLLGDLLFTAPQLSLRQGQNDWWSMLAFVGAGAVIAFATQAHRRSLRRLHFTLEQSERSQAALLASEARLSGIVGSAMDAIITVDEDQRILMFNRAAEQIFRCPASRAIGQPLEKFIPPRFRQGHRQQIADFGRTAPTGRSMAAPGNLWGLRGNGEEFPIEATISQLDEGGQRLFTVVLRDITERVQAERALRASEERLRLAQRAAAMGSWEWDLRTGAVVWSEELCLLHGIRPGSFEGRYESWLATVYPEDRQEAEAAVRDALQRGGAYAAEYRTVLPDGRIRWMAVRGQVFRDPAGQPERLLGVCIDTTEQRESQEHFRTLADNISQFAWMADAEGWIYWYNRRWLEYTGASLAEMKGWGWMKVHHPDHVDRVVATWQHAVQSEQPWEDVFPLRGRDGSYRWFLSRAEPIRGEHGNIIRWFGTNTDITEQRATQEALRRERERLTLSLNAGQMGVYDMNLLDGSRWWSPENYSLFGVSPHLFKPSQESFLALVDPEDRDSYQRQFDEALFQRRPFICDFRIVRPDGAVRWIGSRGQTEYDESGRPTRHFGITLDITERKQVEVKLHEQANLLELSSDAIIVWDQDGRITYWSRGAETLYGWTAEEAQESQIHDLLKTEFPVPLEAITDHVRRENRWEGELLHTCKHGERVNVLSRWALFRDSADNRGQIMEVNTDITARRQMEAALHKAEELAATARMAAMLAHEVNNPLAAIVNIAYLLRSHPQLPPELREHADMLERELQRVGHIVRQTLSYRQQDRPVASVSLPEVMEDVLALFRQKLAGVQVEKHFDPACGIEGNRVELHQLVSNLILNALESLTGSRRLIRIRLAPSREWAHAGRSGVRIVVADSGSGIEGGARSRIFEPFFTTKVQKGTGLGLSVVQWVIAKHQGSIRIRSTTRPGHSGTCVSVFLPAALAKPAPAAVTDVQAVSQAS